MHLWKQRLRKITGGCALAASGAAVVVCIRLAMPSQDNATSQHAVPASGADRPMAGRTTMDITLLLSPERKDRLERWMEERPGEVMAAIDSMDDRALAAELADKFVKAVRNPHHDLLLDWLTRQQDPRIAAAVFQAILPLLSREDAGRCIALSFNLGDGPEARGAREALFSQLPLEQRMRLLEQQKPDERTELLGKTAGTFGARAPEACLEMIAGLPPSAQRSAAVAGLMKSWANGADALRLADPFSAVKATLAVTDPELRKESLKLAVVEWSDRNPDLASAWITELPNGPDRDAAIGGLVTRLAPADAASAKEWAGSISDDALRMETIRRLEQRPSGKAKEER